MSVRRSPNLWTTKIFRFLLLAVLLTLSIITGATGEDNVNDSGDNVVVDVNDRDEGREMAAGSPDPAKHHRGLQSSVNACLDPTSTDYQCELSSTILWLDGCDLTDDDLVDIATCLDDVGRESVGLLVLYNNALTTLPEGLFEGLTSLKTLWLHNNTLTTLPEGLFEGLTGLTTLSLYDNTLTTLPEGLFQNLTALTTLDLYNNALTTLPEGLFQNLTALTSLDLYNNALTTLPEGLFEGLTGLGAVHLSNNALTTLPEGLFEGLTGLTTLNLYNNTLTTLPEGLFEGLTDLTWLYLEENSLECLPTTSLVEVDDDASSTDGIHVDAYGDECGCSITGVTDNVCGNETCTPGEFGYTCGALAPTSAPASVTPVPQSAPEPTAAPNPSSEGSSSTSDSTPMIAGIVSAVAAVVLVAAAVLIKRRRDTKPKAPITQQQPRAVVLPPPANDDDNLGQGPVHAARPLPYSPAFASSSSGGRRPSPPPYMPEADGGGATYPPPPPPPAFEGVTQPSKDRSATATGEDDYPAGPLAGTAAGTTTDTASTARTFTATNSTANVSTAERAELAEFHPREVAGVAAGAAYSADSGPLPEEASGGGSGGGGGAAARRPSTDSGRHGSSGDLGLGQAVLAAAQELARSCQVPGVSEAAGVLVVMANLYTDVRESNKESETRLRQCRAMVMALRRAEKVVGKGGDTMGQTARVLIEDVHDAVFDLVELIRMFQTKKKLSRVFLSTLFKRRLEELDAVVDRAINRLQLGLQIQVGQDMISVRDGVKSVEEGMLHYRRSSIDEAASEAVAEARRIKRQRKLEQVEIPQDQVCISDELLGKGGFGEVFLAEYNTRNAAAKVFHIAHELGDPGEYRGQFSLEREKTLRKALLRELEAMIRLRSPHTVCVYGAITSRPDRLVLVMELLAGGDLRTLLKNSEQPLPEEQSRQIISDICAGMAFLHDKETVHGDLKSANVLLDGTGRGKIGDFGTSRWSHYTNSTGLATHTKGGQNTQMSLAWSAPEVLEASGSTFASDIYSFGIVAWEVLSRELPWASVTHPREVYIRVVLNDLRPNVPVDAPADLANMMTACWAGKPEARPTFSTIMERIRSNGWGE